MKTSQVVWQDGQHVHVNLSVSLSTTTVFQALTVGSILEVLLLLISCSQNAGKFQSITTGTWTGRWKALNDVERDNDKHRDQRRHSRRRRWRRCSRSQTLRRESRLLQRVPQEFVEVLDFSVRQPWKSSAGGSRWGTSGSGNRVEPLSVLIVGSVGVGSTEEIVLEQDQSLVQVERRLLTHHGSSCGQADLVNTRVVILVLLLISYSLLFNLSQTRVLVWVLSNTRTYSFIKLLVHHELYIDTVGHTKSLIANHLILDILNCEVIVISSHFFRVSRITKRRGCRCRQAVLGGRRTPVVPGREVRRPAVRLRRHLLGLEPRPFGSVTADARFGRSVQKSFSSNNFYSSLGNGRGSVGRVVASDTGGLWFES